MAFRSSVRRRTASLSISADPPIAAVPAEYPPVVFTRDSWTYSAPTFHSGSTWKNPEQTKSRPAGVTGRSIWGRYRILIGGSDRSFFRDVPVQVLSWSHAAPLGVETIVLRFPQITPFERPGTDIPWLHDQAKLRLQRVKGDGTVADGWNLCAIKANAHVSWTGSGWALDVEFEGFLYQGDHANNRPTVPGGAQNSRDIGHRIPHRYNQIVGFKGHRIPKIVTGIEQWKKGSLDDSVADFARELLAIGWTADGVQWALMDRDNYPWHSHLVLPDPDTIDYTIPVGAVGAFFELDEDNDERPNVVYAEWVTPDGARTQNLKYPHLLADPGPAFPLGLGASFSPGGTDSGFRPFSRWLDRNGYKIYSDDTYDARDEAEVTDAQDRMGLVDDGLVDATTWGTAFTNVDGDVFADAIYLPLAWDKRVEPYLYTPDGALLGKNPDYDPTIPRREIHINFGENVERADVHQAAKQIVERSKKLSLVGTLSGSADPAECGFRDMRAHRMLNVPYLYGSGSDGVTFYISHFSVDEQSGTYEAQIDTLFRDAWTIAEILERKREARQNPARLSKRNASGLTQDTKQPFDRDNGAGRILPTQLDAATWRVIPFASAAWGTFVRIHADTDPITSWAMMLFAGKVSSNFCERNVGDPFTSDHPYKANAETLKDAGLIQAWGSQSQPCGYSKPNSADGYLSDDDPLTGLFEWDSAVSYWSERVPRLYLAVRPADATDFEARFYNQPVEF